MNIRLCFAALVALVVSACSNQATGQKDRGAALKTKMDSVSYGIGTDIGHNLRVGGYDSLNIDAMAMGIRDGRDSTERVTTEKTHAVVQAYMMAAQQKAMAKTQKAAEGNIKVGEAWLAENGKKPGVITTASGLQYEVVQAGTGPKPTMTDQVKVNYRGTLIDGTEFDSSYKRGQPAEMPIDRWIPGFTEAFLLMPKGSKWKVYVPQNLAYGAQSPGASIPAYSTLIFDLELLDFSPAPAGGGK